MKNNNINIKVILFSCLLMVFCGYCALISYFFNINSVSFDFMITLISFIPLFALGVGVLACMYPKENLITE